MLLVAGYGVGLPLALQKPFTLLNSSFDPVLKSNGWSAMTCDGWPWLPAILAVAALVAQH